MRQRVREGARFYGLAPHLFVLSFSFFCLGVLAFNIAIDLIKESEFLPEVISK